jgi:hypothetical protein
MHRLAPVLALVVVLVVPSSCYDRVWTRLLTVFCCIPSRFSSDAFPIQQHFAGVNCGDLHPPPL